MTKSVNHEQFTALLAKDGPVALIIKQPLTPVDEDDRVIFPPTYPVTDWKARVHSIRDGDYRVTVELPTGSKTDKDEKKDSQRPGYQIDKFSDDENICEIDSPQSQSNRIEPKFKVIEGGKLVPQVEIRVGNDKVNLLDVGHRAGDAVVRMSSLAPEIHDAFTAAKSRDFFKLAALAPTSLVFGVWDSRSTYVKQQRVIKANIRATNVRELSRSAQYTPATAYVDVGAIGEGIEKKKGDESNLSQEGMVHALSTQSVGGVTLTDTSTLVRTVNVNIEAIRALHGIATPVQPTQSNDEGTAETASPVDGSEVLRQYILGLALVAAFDEQPELNLREGCHLRYSDKESDGGRESCKLIYRSKGSEHCTFTFQDVVGFAKRARDEFFTVAKIDEEAIDRRHEVFETGVAEKFLAYPQGDRDKIRKLGPITQATLARFESKGKDPFKPVTDELKNVKQAIGNKPRRRSAQPVVNTEAFSTVAELLDQLANDETLPFGAAPLAAELVEMARTHDDSHHAHKEIGEKIKEYKRALKEGLLQENSGTVEEDSK